MFHCLHLSLGLFSFQSPPHNILGRACQVECLDGRDLQSELQNGVMNQAKPNQLKGHQWQNHSHLFHHSVEITSVTTRSYKSHQQYLHSKPSSMQSVKRSWARRAPLDTGGSARNEKHYHMSLPNVSARATKWSYHVSARQHPGPPSIIAFWKSRTGKKLKIGSIWELGRAH